MSFTEIRSCLDKIEAAMKVGNITDSQDSRDELMDYLEVLDGDLARLRLSSKKGFKSKTETVKPSKEKRGYIPKGIFRNYLLLSANDETLVSKQFTKLFRASLERWPADAKALADLEFKSFVASAQTAEDYSELHTAFIDSFFGKFFSAAAVKKHGELLDLFFRDPETAKFLDDSKIHKTHSFVGDLKQ